MSASDLTSPESNDLLGDGTFSAGFSLIHTLTRPSRVTKILDSSITKSGYSIRRYLVADKISMSKYRASLNVRSDTRSIVAWKRSTYTNRQ